MDCCEHFGLNFETPSSKSKRVFKRASTPDRIAASHATEVTKKTRTQAKGKRLAFDTSTTFESPLASTFPGPLVLPGDDLYEDPECPPQTMQEWIDEEDRNPVTRARRTVYVVPPPSVPDAMSYVNSWTDPRTKDLPEHGDWRRTKPNVEDVLDYLRAFYHPLPVKLLQKPQLRWVEWEEHSGARRQAGRPTYIGLDIGNEAVRITTRDSLDGLFSGQLNLNDLIDATIAFLPKDAYALVMLLDQDIYEDDDDDFCCGRAYGNSRVAVVSMARYNPVLDGVQQVERLHAWPASHCIEYGDSLRRSVKRAEKSKVRGVGELDRRASAMSLAVAASAVLDQDMASLWLGRVCKTTSHEVGHCFALDHCTFYACIMQSTCKMSEDARQPPYLCPVDMAKLLSATGASETERDHELLRFCKRFEARDSMLAGFAAWLRFRLGMGE